MTTHVEQMAAEQLGTRIWAVHDFCKRHRIHEDEEQRLSQLFGEFASASELLYNASRSPRWRG